MSATLRQLIEQATPGPWHSSSNTLHEASGIAIAECLSRGSETPSPESNAQFIARCNPATMLAVLEALLASRHSMETGNDMRMRIVKVNEALSLLNAHP